MKKLNSKGFSGLEIVLVILVAGLLIGGGYYVYKNKTPKKSDSTTQTQDTPQEASKPTRETPDPYEGWKTYTEGTYSFKYPADWTYDIEDNSYAGHRLFLLSPTKRSAIYVANDLGTDYCDGVESTKTEINIKFDGKTYKTNEIDCAGNHTVVSIHLEKNGKKYIVFISGGEYATDIGGKTGKKADYTANKDTITKILESFMIK